MSEIEQMIAKAREAQAIYVRHFDQDDVDAAVKITTKTIYDHAEELARMAIDETQMGVYEDKVAKNRNKSKGVWWDLHAKKSTPIRKSAPPRLSTSSARLCKPSTCPRAWCRLCVSQPSRRLRS